MSDRLKALAESGVAYETVREPGRVELRPVGISRRRLMRLGIGFLPLVLLPQGARAATNFLWSGAGTYNAGATNWLTTELNSLANSTANVLSTLGAAFQNTSSWIFADPEFLAGGTLTPTAGAFVELWLLRSLDGGTNYEDGSATIAPGRVADVVIPVRAGTTITPRAGASGLFLPPAFYKPIARNQTGVALPASGNIVRFSAYTEQY